MRELVPAKVAALPWRIIFLLIAIAAFGALVLYSAAGGGWTWAGPHVVRFGLLLAVIVVVVRRIPLDVFRRLAIPAYAGCLLLLILVELLGQMSGGSQRWLSLGGFTLQPSELMKIAIILLLARFYEHLPAGMVPTRRAIWIPLAILALPAALVLVQPDLDAAVLIIAVGAVVMFLGGLPLRIFGGAAITAAIVAPLAYFLVLEEYQQRRLTSFLAPETDPLGAGYHVIQSQIAIGSGGLFGKGFLGGSQARLNYLPEHHTDLVFAALAEEWGFVGGAALMFAYFLLLRWGFQTASAARSRFGRLAVLGLTTMIFFYIAMNMLTATGLTPVMGMPLPLVSHGGSAMLTVMLAIGVIMAVEREELVKNRASTFAAP